MDRFVGPAQLEWWANDSMCVGVYGIGITITVDDAGTWRATGRHAEPLHGTDREGWDFLMELDPDFSLAFPGEDRGGITVHVAEAEDGTLALTERRTGTAP